MLFGLINNSIANKIFRTKLTILSVLSKRLNEFKVGVPFLFLFIYFANKHFYNLQFGLLTPILEINNACPLR